MKMICNTNDFKNGLALTTKVVDAKNSVTQMCCVLLKTTDKGTVKITGCDSVTTVVCEVPVKVEESGSILIPAKKFAEFVSKLPQGDFRLSVSDKNEVTLKSLEGKTKFTLGGISSDSYPEIAKFSAQKSFSISYSVLKEMLDGVLFCTSKDEAKQVLTGCNFDYDKTSGCLSVVATDGFRMGIRRTDIDISDDFSIIVPAKTIAEITKDFNEEDTVNVSFNSNLVKFETDNVCVVSSLISGPYVSYKSIIQSQPVTSFEVNANDMYEASDRSLLVSENRRTAMRCSLKSGELSLSTNSELGVIDDEIETNGFSGKELTVYLNASYMRDVFRTVEDETCKVESCGEVNPFYVRSATGTKFTYLILPIRNANK